MKPVMRLAIVLLPLLFGAAHAQPTDWWNAAYNSNSMLNKDLASTWLANKGDNLTKIVRTMYGIPADKQSTTDRVIDAVIKFNNALNMNKEMYNEAKVTPIVDRNKIYEGNQYFVPDPKSIDRILKGEDPAQVMLEAMGNAANQAQARGEPDGTPLHAPMGAIATDASDGDAAAATPTPTPTPAGSVTPPAPPLGSNLVYGPNGELTGVTEILGVQPAPGPKRPEGANPNGDQPQEIHERGNIQLTTAYDFLNATPATVRREGAAKAASTAGVTAGQLSDPTN